MSKIIALDIGLKRTGIAVTDELRILSSPLKTVKTDQLIKFLEVYFKVNIIEIMVLGSPKNINLESTDNTNLVNTIKKVLENKFPKIKIEMIDERYTSKISKDFILSMGYKKSKRKEKELLDEISASFILQSYLDQIRNSK